MSRVVVLGYRKGIDASLRRRGLRPFFVVERYKEGLAGQDYRVVTNLEDAQEVLRVLLAAELGAVCAVMTDREEGVFSTAVLRRHLGLSPVDPARLLLFRDKFLQKAALPDGVARASCVYVTADRDYPRLSTELGPVFVVKPANGSGAHATSVIRSANDFDTYLARNPRGTEHALVAESFVDGVEFHIDGVWRAGVLEWSSVCRFLDPPMVWQTDGILAEQVLARRSEPELFAQAEQMAELALNALGAPDCVFHMEAFEVEGGVVFGECAARLPGALIPEIVGLTHGIDLYDVQVALALDEKPALPLLPTNEPEVCFGYVYLRKYPSAPRNADAFRARFDPVELTYDGDPEAPEGIYGNVGHMIVCNRDPVALRRTLSDVTRFNRVGSL